MLAKFLFSFGYFIFIFQAPVFAGLDKFSFLDKVDNWIIEAESSYNDGYTREYYMSLLRDLKQRLNSLEILNEQNHG